MNGTRQFTFYAPVLDGLPIKQNERPGLVDAAQRHAARPDGAPRLAERAAAQIKAGHMVQHIAEA
jgi:predicted regulator of Ras-like GTPase activity (Roadblock/LC7/MglB family)